MPDAEIDVPLDNLYVRRKKERIDYLLLLLQGKGRRVSEPKWWLDLGVGLRINLRRSFTVVQISEYLIRREMGNETKMALADRQKLTPLLDLFSFVFLFPDDRQCN